MKFEEASRMNVRIKMALASLAGGGKTLGALLIAKGIIKDMTKVGVLQTETGRAECYLKKFPGFKVLNLSPPYSPERYIEAIKTAEAAGIKILIIDSLSDEWTGSGGMLDESNKASAVSTNSFVAWKKLTPRHDALFQYIMGSKIHIIATLRKKTDYILEDVKNRQGKMVKQPRKVGLKDLQRDDGDYKWMIQLDLDSENMVKVIKDNTSLFQGKEFKITEDTGSSIRDWCLN